MILHPNAEIRERATGYFLRSFSRDPAVARQIIAAIERYGHEEADALVECLDGLAHTPETVDWLVAELISGRAGAEDYAVWAAGALASADPALVADRAAEILAAEDFEDFREEFRDRQEMHTWDEARCWEELEALLAAAARGKGRRAEAALARRERLVPALARVAGPETRRRVLDALALANEDAGDAPEAEDADAYSNVAARRRRVAIELAGRLGMVEAVPLLFALIREDDEDLGLDCEDALVRIGGDAVVEAAANVYPRSQRDLRAAAVSVLGSVRSDLAVEKCLALLEREENWYYRVELADAGLAQFAHAAVEPARQVALAHRGELECVRLRRELVLVSEALEAEFPERVAWKAEMARFEEARRRWTDRLGSDPSEDRESLRPAPPLFAAAPKSLEFTPGAAGAQALPPGAALPARSAVGRNDPCPCGSGKKYKKCCLNRTAT